MMQRRPIHRFAVRNYYASSGVGWEKADVWIIQNLAINGNEGCIQDAGCRDNDLVSGVAVEFVRKLRGPTKPRYEYLGLSPRSLPVRVCHRFRGVKKCDRFAAQRIAGAVGGNGCERKDDDLDGLAATKRNAAQRNHAILGQCGFGTMSLHNDNLKHHRSQGKRAKCRVAATKSSNEVLRDNPDMNP